MNDQRTVLASCPLCGGNRLHKLFDAQGMPIARCEGCGLTMRNPQPSDAELAAIYTDTYFLGSGHGGTEDSRLKLLVDNLKRQTAVVYLDQIEAYRKRTPGATIGNRLLEVGCGHGNFLVEAKARGFDVAGLELSKDAAAVANAKLGATRVVADLIEETNLPQHHFDICVLADVIEHTRDPVDFLRHVNKALKPGGIVFIATPNLGSWSARLMGNRWMEFKPEHIFYFSGETLEKALDKTGFDNIGRERGLKVLNIEYIALHFERFPVAGITPLLRGLEKVLPRAASSRPLKLVASGINMMATAG